MKRTAFLMLISLCFFISCAMIQEKEKYDTLVKEHISLRNSPDTIIFGLVINEPKEITMAKLCAKGLYSELGFTPYSFNSLNTNLNKLKWNYNLSFYNDSLKGISFHTSVSDINHINVKNALIELYDKKYPESCFYEKSNYFFNGNVMIEMSSNKYAKDEYIISLSYSQIYWFARMNCPSYSEKDKYGNDLYNYYSNDYKKPNSDKDPALEEI